MLVLTVREDDVIELGGNIRIMVRRLKKGVLKVAIDAPPEVDVRRLSPGGFSGDLRDDHRGDLAYDPASDPAVQTGRAWRRPGGAEQEGRSAVPSGRAPAFDDEVPAAVYITTRRRPPSR